MGFQFIGADADQPFLLPPDPRDWLPPDHLAWAVRRAVEGLDLSGFLSSYRSDGVGRPAYHPRVMVGLVCYCYCKGIRSSRRIQAACVDDLGCRVLTGNRQPDHATVARFVRRHASALKGLFVQVLVVLAGDGLVEVDVVAADGTKVKANASMAANRTAERLQADIEGLQALLEAEVACWLVQAQAADAAEDGQGDGGQGPGGGVAGGQARRRTAERLARARQARGLLAERGSKAAQAVAEARVRVGQARARLAGQVAAQQARLERYRLRGRLRVEGGRVTASGWRGGPPVPVEQARGVRRARGGLQRAQRGLRRAQAMADAAKANTTDPSSRVMLAKHGGYEQDDNLQVLANRHQVILAVGTHDNPTDVGGLHPLLQAARANLDAAGIPGRIGAALADSGYAASDNFTSPCEARLYVAVHHQAAQTGRGDPCDKPMPAGWQQMAQRMATDEAKRLYRQRAQMIEPAFAQLFGRLGRQLHYRGDMVDVELHLWAMTHNLLKHIRHLTRPASAVPAPALAA
jgi:transposase